MKQTTRYILALAAMFLFITGAMADNTATVTKLLDGAAPTTDPGTVVYENGKITVTPTNGNYLTVADLTVVKTIDGSNAEARRRAPGFDNQVVLTASDPTADPSGQTEYTFTVTDTKFDYEITANFHARTDISGATVTVTGDPFTFTGTAITPNVNVTVGGTPLAQGTDFDVTYASNTNAGTASFTITGTRTYNGTITGNTFTINQVAGSISYATASVKKTYGDANFTQPLTLTGDGTVTYATSNAKVADVDAATGEVTITGEGIATITATAIDGTNYTYASETNTANYTITVAPAEMTVTASGFTGDYDGQAHSITVTAPEGATVKYGETEGVFDLSASPTYINAGGYTVYYQVTKPNYATMTGSQVVTINQAAGSISYATASVKKTYGDINFTHPLTLTGDGTVSYATSDADVADVDAATGEVTITGEGTATITGTAIDGTNYTYASGTNTANYSITVAPAEMTVTASGFTGDYDGQAHSITVTAPEGATVKYGETEGVFDLSASPTYTNAGGYTVYYQVTMPNYATVTGSQNVTINKAPGSINYATASVKKTYGDVNFTQPLALTGDGTVTYATSNAKVADVDAATGEVTITGEGIATITATAIDGTNYTYASGTNTANYSITVAPAEMTVTASGFTGDYDGQTHGITVTAPDGATVIYGETPGVYNLNVSPTYTNAGGYTVYYQVTKANYITVTGSQVVTINQAPGSISYATASVKKTYGDANFTHPLTLTGDGTVSYATSNAEVADVDASTGEVTITGEGTATITATAIDGTNYIYASKTNTANYTITVAPAKMTVTASGYTGDYDGKAHSINVTAPEGATVKYGETEGVYYLSASPIYANVGTYTVYYQVTMLNYITVTGSQDVTINKAPGSISYATASVKKTYGDANFTQPLTLTGDGTASYATSDADVAAVDAATGEVTITGEGTATITATAIDGTNYTYASETNAANYTITVAPAKMTVTVSGYTGDYDGKAHTITVTAPEGATVKYGETEGVYYLSASPIYANVGTYTVYYQVTKPNYATVTGSETVTITKANAKVEFAKKEYTVRIGEEFDAPQVTLDPADLVVTYSSSDDEVATVDAQTGEVTLVAPGKVTITATFVGDENYNAASDSYVLEVLQRDIDPIDEDVIYAMTDDVFFVLNEDGTIEEIKLDNTVIFDLLFTLDISGDPSESDGYDETEKCIVLNTPMSTDALNGLIISGVEPGSDEYAAIYTGLTFKVPAGTGYVIIDAQTDGEHQMMVKIGELPPVAFNHTGRDKDSILYECSVPTWVYVYNGDKISNARMLSNHRAKKERGHVKIYSVTRSSSSGQGDGIELINSETLESDRWYDLQGNRIYRPTKKGVYILQGKKVIVK